MLKCSYKQLGLGGNTELHTNKEETAESLDKQAPSTHLIHRSSLIAVRTVNDGVIFEAVLTSKRLRDTPFTSFPITQPDYFGDMTRSAINPLV